jgi:hypothetical protein
MTGKTLCAPVWGFSLMLTMYFLRQRPVKTAPLCGQKLFRVVLKKAE